MPIREDRIAADVAALAAITRTPGNGATRPTFSDEWGRARDYVIDEARKIDCAARIDASGNLFVKPASLLAQEPTWLCGSHLDTVPHGGDYDGVAGVVTALELLRSAHDDGIVLPLTLVVFAEEEGPTFGLGMLGSRALVGELSADQLGAMKNADGQTYLEAGAPFGVDAGRIAADRLDPSRHLGLIELHIEQGPAMWRRDQNLSVVTAIAGRRQFLVTIHGEANHAGATSMADRKDALVAAAEVVIGLEKLAGEIGGDAVVTVGRLDVSPNAVNVIAERVHFTIDFRSPDDDDLSQGTKRITRLVSDVCARRPDDEMRYELLPTERIPARPMDAGLVAALRRAAELVPYEPLPTPAGAPAGLAAALDEVRRMTHAARGPLPLVVSGALHDSAVLAPHLPTVMLFVPSRDGISHNPAEFSRVEDIATGARVIEHLVRRPTVAMLNAMERAAFVKAIGHVYEHSPWIAGRASDARPFASVDALAAAMSAVVRRSSRDEQLALIRAHPDLVGRLADLTPASRGEQRAAGLTDVSPEEADAFGHFNAAYRDRFGFPFVICARENKKAAILAAFPARLRNDVDAEVATALAEIDKIARLRLADAVWESPPPSSTPIRD